MRVPKQNFTFINLFAININIFYFYLIFLKAKLTWFIGTLAIPIQLLQVGRILSVQLNCRNFENIDEITKYFGAALQIPPSLIY